MIKIYTLNQYIMNGTITVATIPTSFVDKKLAEEAMDVLMQQNQNSPFDCTYAIKESVVYENREEVPCLNDKTNVN